MKAEKRVCIITQSHLCRNPRVLKEAITLSTNGYEVIILTSIYSTELYKQDLNLIKNHPIKIIIVSDLIINGLSSFIYKAFKKLGNILVKKLGIETSLALGYGSFNYFHKAMRLRADLYVCHQELATYIGNKLIKQGFKVAFDIEDWYSEDLLPDARADRPIKLLKESEQRALANGIFSLTTSNTLAEKLSDTFNVKRPFTVYNVFPSHHNLLNKQHNFSGAIKLFWFSQTIGPGRGLEQFIEIIKQFDLLLELHLLGNVDTEYQNQLEKLMDKKHPLTFHELVDEKDLAEKIAKFDIGLALELNNPPSRNFTITNKFFQYLQSGLPIIASKTDGQDEAFDQFNPGFKLSQNPANSEVEELKQWLNNKEALHKARQNAVKAAYFYNWENESVKLIGIIKNHLDAG